MPKETKPKADGKKGAKPRAKAGGGPILDVSVYLETTELLDWKEILVDVEM